MTQPAETPASVPAERSPFIEGYLDRRYREGFRPAPHYPASRLPDAGDRVMEVVTCWRVQAGTKR